MADHVVVFSHRRSGTHLTIDAIRNNFAAYEAPFINLDDLQTDSHSEKRVESYTDRLAAAPCVIKSHAPAEIEAHFHTEKGREMVLNIVGRSKIIYVYRDGRDVMTSYYHYACSVNPNVRSRSFSEFLRMKDPLGIRKSFPMLNNVEYWKHHVSSWLNENNVLFLSYESLVGSYDEQIVRLSSFLGLQEPKKITNIIRTTPKGQSSWNVFTRGREKLFKLYSQYVAGRELTSVNFRQGKTGAFVDVFSADDLEYFDAVAADLLSDLGYAPSSSLV